MEKNHYAHMPPAVRVQRAGEYAHAFFTENAAPVITDGAAQYACDEYRLTLPYTPGLAERIMVSPASWLQKAKAEDHAQAAAAVRAKRDALLQESDKDMALDRLGLVIPTGSTFSAWLSFLRSLGSALSGAKAAYRQALRDLPRQEGFPYDVTWPERPEA